MQEMTFDKLTRALLHQLIAMLITIVKAGGRTRAEAQFEVLDMLAQALQSELCDYNEPRKVTR